MLFASDKARNLGAERGASVTAVKKQGTGSCEQIDFFHFAAILGVIKNVWRAALPRQQPKLRRLPGPGEVGLPAFRGNLCL